MLCLTEFGFIGCRWAMLLGVVFASNRCRRELYIFVWHLGLSLWFSLLFLHSSVPFMHTQNRHTDYAVNDQGTNFLQRFQQWVKIAINERRNENITYIKKVSSGSEDDQFFRRSDDLFFNYWVNKGIDKISAEWINDDWVVGRGSSVVSSVSSVLSP